MAGSLGPIPYRNPRVLNGSRERGTCTSFNLQNPRKKQGLGVPELRGINQASTFTGFCARHDDTIFAPLEKQTFSGTPEQCFLLGYRALAREFHAKRAAAAALPGLFREMERGRTREEQAAIQKISCRYEVGLESGCRDNDHYKSIHDGILESQEFNTVRAYIIEFEATPSVMCSGAASPEQDFGGVKLQDVNDLKSIPDLLSFTSFYGGERGVVVFSWLAESDRTFCAFIEEFESNT